MTNCCVAGWSVSISGRKVQGQLPTTCRGRELYAEAAREGIALPDVARGCLMLIRARLGRERQAVVLAAAGQSYNVRAAFPRNFGHVGRVCACVGREWRADGRNGCPCGARGGRRTNWIKWWLIFSQGLARGKRMWLKRKRQSARLVTWKKARETIQQDWTAQDKDKRLWHFSRDWPDRARNKLVASVAPLVLFTQCNCGISESAQNWMNYCKRSRGVVSTSKARGWGWIWR